MEASRRFHLGLFLLLLSSKAISAATAQPAQAPSSPVSVLSSDCFVSNAGDTECIYELGTCMTDDDCSSVLSDYLSSFKVTNSQIPSNATYGCLKSDKCALFFPSTGCLTEINLPTCAVAPASAPASAPVMAPVSAPVSILPSDCYVTNAASTQCEYQVGTCQADTDCSPIISSYLSSFGVTARVSALELPTNATFGCLDNGKCDLFLPSNGCLAGVNLPPCSIAPGPSLVSAPFASAPGPEGSSTPTIKVTAPPPSVVFAPICSSSILGTGKGCCLEFGGACQTARDCDLSIATYLTLVPDDGFQNCYGGRCYFATEEAACTELGKTLPTCTNGNTCTLSSVNMSSVSPPPAVNVHLLTSPPALAPAATASVPSPTPSPVLAPNVVPQAVPSASPPPASAARPFAALSHGLLLVTILIMAGSSLLSL